MKWYRDCYSSKQLGWMSFSNYTNKVATDRCEKVKYCKLIISSAVSDLETRARNTLGIPDLRDQYTLHGLISAQLKYYLRRELGKIYPKGWDSDIENDANAGQFDPTNNTLYPDYRERGVHTEYRFEYMFCPDDNSITPKVLNATIEKLFDDMAKIEPTINRSWFKVVTAKVTVSIPKQLKKVKEKPEYPPIYDSHHILVERGDIIAYAYGENLRFEIALGIVKDWTKQFVILSDGRRVYATKTIVVKSLQNNKVLAANALVDEASKFDGFNYFE